MICRWCGRALSFGHNCSAAPVDQRHEAADYLAGVHAAINARGRHYVMVEPTRDMAHGPFVRLTLAKAGDTLLTDRVLDRREIEVSEGGLGHLNSKYGYLGVFETFDDLPTARARYSEFFKEVMAYAKLSLA